MKTEAEKRAQKKYDQKYDFITFRVPKGKKKEIEEYAKTQKLSCNHFLNKVIFDAILSNKAK